MFNILLIAFFLLFVFLTARQLLWGVCLVVAFLPSYLIRFTLLGVPFTVLEGMILLLTLVWVIKNRLRWGEVVKKLATGKLPVAPFNQWFVVTVIFVISATAAVFVSGNFQSAMGIWKAYFVEPILFFAVFISSVRKRSDVNRVLISLVLGGAVVAVFAVIQQFTGWLIPNSFWQAIATRRVTGFFGYPNAVALYLAPLVPLVTYLFEKNRIEKRNLWVELFYFGIFVLFIAAIFFTHSFGALLALAVTVTIFGLINKKSRLVALILVVVAGFVIFLSPLKDPFGQEVLMKGTSGQLRVAMWGETIEMLRNHPLGGAGLSNYQNVVAPYHILNWAEIYLYPHNLFLNFWSETGLIGLIAFLWLVALFFREGFTQLKDKKHHGYLLAEALLASMFIVLIHGLVDVPYFKNDLSVLFWLLMGLLAVNSFVKD